MVAYTQINNQASVKEKHQVEENSKKKEQQHFFFDISRNVFSPISAFICFSSNAYKSVIILITNCQIGHTVPPNIEIFRW